MPVVSPGGDAPTDVLFQSSAGSPIVASGVEVTIKDAVGGVVAGPFDSSTGVTNPQPGYYRYVWSVPAGQDLGSYFAWWTGTVAGVETVGADNIYVVAAGSVVPVAPARRGQAGNSYCTYYEVKARLAGTGNNMSWDYDQVLADKALEISRDIDRMVGKVRHVRSFSFLEDTQYAEQVVGIAGPGTATGTFVLEFGGDTTAMLSTLAAAADVQAALEALPSIGAGGVVVSGRAGGPWHVTFAGAKTGPQDRLGGASWIEPEGGLVFQVVRQGVASTPSERLYAAIPDTSFLPIDDCTSVSLVRVYAADGVTVEETLTEGSTWRAWPYNGEPIEAIEIEGRCWPDRPRLIGVTAKWGYASEVPTDVREAAIIEEIRSYMADRTGNDDRVGTTPWGMTVQSKAYTAKVYQLTKEYGRDGLMGVIW